MEDVDKLKEQEMLVDESENARSDTGIINITITRMGGLPIAIAIPKSSTFGDLKTAAARAVPVGVFGFKLVTEDFECLQSSLDTPIADLNLNDGVFLTMITETCRDYSRIVGPEQVLKTGKHPCGIYIDDEGNFFINHYYGEFKKYNAKFEFVCESKIPNNPWQLARAPSGEFVIAYKFTGIHVFDPITLEQTRVIPARACKGVAVEGDLVYASDEYNNAIQVLQFKDGEVVGTHKPGLKQPSCLTVIDSRLLAVADRGNDRILLLDLQSFEVRSKLPPDGAASHQRLSKPNDVVVDSAGNLLVMDVGGERIVVFREDGTFVASILEGFFVNHGNTYPYLSYNQITGAIAASNDDEHCVTIFSPIFEADDKTAVAEPGEAGKIAQQLPDVEADDKTIVSESREAGKFTQRLRDEVVAVRSGANTCQDNDASSDQIDPRWDVDAFNEYCNLAALAWVKVGFLRKRNKRRVFTSWEDCSADSLNIGAPPADKRLYSVSSCRAKAHCKYLDAKGFYLNALVAVLDDDDAVDDDLVFWPHISDEQKFDFATGAAILSSDEAAMLRKRSAHLLYLHFRIKHIVLPELPDDDRDEHVPYFAEVRTCFEFSMGVFAQRVVNSQHPVVKSHTTPEWFLRVEQNLSNMGDETVAALIQQRRKFGNLMPSSQNDAIGFQTICQEAEFRWIKVWFIHELATRTGPAPRCQDLPPNAFITGIVPPGCQAHVLSYSWSSHTHFAPAGAKMKELSRTLKMLEAKAEDVCFIDYMSLCQQGAWVPKIYKDMNTYATVVQEKDGMVELPGRTESQSNKFAFALFESTRLYSFAGGERDGKKVLGCKVIILPNREDAKAFPDAGDIKEEMNTLCVPPALQPKSNWGFQRAEPYWQGGWTCAEFAVARKNGTIANLSDDDVKRVMEARSWPDDVFQYADMMDESNPLPVSFTRRGDREAVRFNFFKYSYHINDQLGDLSQSVQRLVAPCNEAVTAEAPAVLVASQISREQSSSLALTTELSSIDFSHGVEELVGCNISKIASGRAKYSELCYAEGKVFGAPFMAGAILIYDMEKGEARGADIRSLVSCEGGKFGSVAAVAGKVVCIPFNAPCLLVLDIATEALSSVDVSGILSGGEKNKYRSSCVAGSKIVAAPCDAGEMILYDVLTEEVRAINLDPACKASLNWKFQGVCAVQDKFVAAPFNSSCLLVYDVPNDLVQGVDVSEFATGERKFLGLCVCGTKVICAPFSSANLLIYDVANGQLSGVDITHLAAGQYKFAFICQTQDIVVAAPYSGDELLIYNTITEELRGVGKGQLGSHTRKFGSICASSDRVVMAPCDGDSLFVYNIVTDELKGFDISSVATGTSKFSNVVDVDGTIFAMPDSSDTALICKVGRQIAIALMPSDSGETCSCLSLGGSLIDDIPMDVLVCELRDRVAQKLSQKPKSLKFCLPSGAIITRDHEEDRTLQLTTLLADDDA